MSAQPSMPVESKIATLTWRQKERQRMEAEAVLVQANPFRSPTLRIEVWDLSHPMATVLLSSVNMQTLLQDAYQSVLFLLYDMPLLAPPQTPTSSNVVIPPSHPSSSTPPPQQQQHPRRLHHIPHVRSITLLLRPMPGVAHTTGNPLDNAHKEIHLSLHHIANTAPDLRIAEMKGVIRHEMVHAWQHDANGTAPGGLIEGLADWVRLKGGLAPPHWRRRWSKKERKKDCHNDDDDNNNDNNVKWDSGYEITAFFLDWCERRFGLGTVMRMNERLRDRDWDEIAFFDWCFGKKMVDLWTDYCESCENKIEV